jgi:VanZ family protein
MPRPWRWTICLAYAAAVAALSLAPSRSFEEAPTLFPHQDKVVHALLYAILAGLGLWTVSPERPSLGAVGLVVLAAAVYGAALEVCQEWMRPGDRQFSLGDVAANAAGALASAWSRRLGNRRAS